jgi:hypothetical protein
VAALAQPEVVQQTDARLLALREEKTKGGGQIEREGGVKKPWV